MDELVPKYFKKDLTEAEEAALSEKLLANPEDSLAFAEAAEKAYQRYGLPEPRWPGNPDDFPRPRPFGVSWMWFAFLLLMLGSAAVVWHFYRNRTAPALLTPGAAGPSSLRGSPAGPAGGGGEAKAPSAPSKTRMVPSSLRISFVGTPARPSGTSGKVAFSPGTPSTTPINVGGQPSNRAHSDLEVVVRWPQAGQVTVRVLSEDGSKEILLYQGLLQRGKWAFDWDGRLSDGRTAPAGAYQILVEAGSVTQSKAIVIR